MEGINPAEILSNMMGGEDKRNDSVEAHYGIKREAFRKMYKEMFGHLIMHEAISSTIDKFFSKLSTEERAKIFAFHLAMQRMQDIINFEKETNPSIKMFSM